MIVSYFSTFSSKIKYIKVREITNVVKVSEIESDQNAGTVYNPKYLHKFNTLIDQIKEDLRDY
jgi:hypothetical protein